MSLPAVLLPASATWPDDPWRDEAVAAAQVGMETFRFDEGALLRGDVGEVLRRLPRGDGPIVVRSGPLPADTYAALHAALGRQGWRPPTTPEAFRRGNDGPSAWSRLRFAHRAETTFLAGFDEAEAWGAFQALDGPVILHDHASSVLQPDEGMAYLPADADRLHLRAAITEVRAARGDELVGGLTLRRTVGVEPGVDLPTERVVRFVSLQGQALWDEVPTALGDVALLHLSLGVPFLALDVALDELDTPLLVGVAEASGTTWPGGLDLVDVYRKLAAAHGRT